MAGDPGINIVSAITPHQRHCAPVRSSCIFPRVIGAVSREYHFPLNYLRQSLSEEVPDNYLTSG
jgi:hypothetical protein